VLKPIIELDIGHIGQKYEEWLSVSADEYLRLELLAKLHISVAAALPLCSS